MAGTEGAAGDNKDAGEREALHRGIALASQGRLDEAAACFREAVRLRPDSAEAHNALGQALRLLGRDDEALAHLRRALQLRPDAVEVHANLGTLLAARGDREALAYAQQAHQLRPGQASPATFSDLGACLLKVGLLDEAEACLRLSLNYRPDDVGTLSDLGTALWAKGLGEQAEVYFRRALSLHPDHPTLLNNLGNVLWDRRLVEEAEGCYRRAIALQPDSAEAHLNLGIVLSDRGSLDEAVASLGQAIRLRPDLHSAHNSLGATFARQGKLDEALACYERALSLRPDYAEARRNRGMVWLTRGDFERGWPEYEWRRKCRDVRTAPLRQPPWDGADLGGRTILLHAEQGLGDTLQFIRYAPLVKRMGGTVLVICPEPLVRLLARVPGVDRVLAAGSDLPEFDVHAPLLSLPALFGTTLATIPAEVPYLSAEPEGIERWRHALAGIPGFKVGIAWQGNPRYPRDRARSFALERLAPLAALPGVRLISLQKSPGAEQVAALAGRFPVTVADDLAEGGLADFLETAAAVKNLDLVVTVDSAVAHLAGGLGVPVWVPQPYVAEWRWLLDREDSPWYPTMRLFRQASPGDWERVFGRITEALGRVMAKGN